MAIAKEFKLTKEGLEELEQELKQLKELRPQITEQIKTARELGDLSENDEYASAREEQARAEGRITEIEHILQNYELLDGKKTSIIRLGSVVVLETADKKEVTYSIVDSIEVDPVERKISDESPIGQALLGKKVGASVEIELPAGKKLYTVKSVK